MTTEIRTRIEEIIWCLGQADQVTVDAARERSSLRWTAAQKICEELDTGRTQRDLAEEIDKSQPFVSYMVQTHKIFSDNPGYQERSFDACFKEIQKRGPELWTPIVQKLSADGMSNRAIGKKLGLDEKTVRTYLARAEETPSDETDEDGETCSPINPFPGTFESFCREGRLLVQLQQIKENRADFDKVRKAVTTFGTALDRIERKYYQ